MEKIKFLLEELKSFDSQFPYSYEGDIRTYIKDKSELFKQRLQALVTRYKKEVGDYLYPGGRRMDSIIENFDKMKEAADRVFELYYCGDIFGAYEVFERGLRDLHLTGADSPFLYHIDEGKEFYRARKPEAGKEFSKQDMFHIPFNLRHIVSSNRYSIPGFPSLYLGGSTYTCWSEFDKPDFKSLNFSKIQTGFILSILEILPLPLYLLETPEFKSNHDVHRFWGVINLFYLSFLCSIKVQFPNGHFKPEYIFPQFLLQFVRRQSIDGIKYPSTKIDYSRLKGFDGHNYVFPIDTYSTGDQKFCSKLLDYFSITEPTSLYYEELLNDSSSSLFQKDPNILIDSHLNLRYHDTAFHKLERYFANKNKKFTHVLK